ncbi:hypothetical protein CKY20_07310 [Capnocytophaga canis]|uniref:Acyltransferase 3 domain-containing protein n=1 Tax=Capnocytophaga canis TaxID=1848903 RepID=A0A3A1YGU0_9FLAO|nr:acyltransferase [Capnocytophaga canis]RIY36290.1 hypothetical protein CKY20_07310 [Capnocytophaga canis]
MRIKELDAFRGLAALSVLVYHFTARYTQIFGDKMYFSFSYGWLGVPVFFILSGFVIHLTLDNCKSAKDFLFKRFFRLYPTYWIAICCTLLVVYLSQIEVLKIPLVHILVNFTMWHDFFGFKHIDGVYWSLLPELLFYLFMAFLFIIKGLDRYYMYNSILLIFCVIHYLFSLPIIGKILDLHYVLLFMVGIAFYRIYTRKNTFLEHIFIISNVFIGTFLYQVEQSSTSVKFLLFALIGIVILYYLFVYGFLSFLSKIKFLLFLGNISYALYLVHQNIGYVTIYYLRDSVGLFMAILIASLQAVLLAYFITYFIEPKFRKRLKKILFNEK